MSGADLRAERQRLGMTQTEFGDHIAKLLGNARAYLQQEVDAWENERGRKVPAKVESALLRAQLERKA